MMLRHAVLFMSLSSALGLSIGGVGSVRPASPPARASRVRAVAELVRTDSPPPASLSGALPDCPATIWDADALDVDMWQKNYKDENLAACPIEVVATDAANAQGEEYFLERRDVRCLSQLDAEARVCTNACRQCDVDDGARREARRRSR